MRRGRERLFVTACHRLPLGRRGRPRGPCRATRSRPPGPHGPRGPRPAPGRPRGPRAPPSPRWTGRGCPSRRPR
ncbi:MAG TPA: hypothetical protein DGR79_04885 [Clostridiales bacterium]|nr:hypothetical protein [Clostridiales bacterium]